MIRIVSLLFIISVILLFTAINNKAHASFTVGLSISYVKNNDTVYNYVDKPVNNFNYGYYHHYGNFHLSLFTNRFVNWHEEKRVERNGVFFTNKTKINYEALQVGYRIKRFVPSVFIANAHIKKRLYYQGSYAGKTKNSLITYGFGSSYIITRNFLGSINVVMPNQEMKYGLSLSINYLF